MWTVQLRSRQKDDYSLGRRCLAAVFNVPLGPRTDAVPRVKRTRLVEMPIAVLPKVRRNLMAAGAGALLTAVLGTVVAMAAASGVLPTPFAERWPSTSVKGYERVEDPAGFSLLVPAGWRRTADQERIVYAPEDSRARLLRIDATNEPCTTPRLYLDLESIEKKLSGKPGYHGFIIRTAGATSDSPAELPYLYDDAKLGSQQVILRSFRGPDRARYTLTAKAPSDDWPDTFTVIDRASRSFCVSGHPCIAPR